MRASVIDEPTFHSTNVNGPVPLALFSSPVASAWSTAPARRVMRYMKSLSGSVSVTTTVESSGASTDAMPASRAVSLAPSARWASSDHTTSADGERLAAVERRRPPGA